MKNDYSLELTNLEQKFIDELDILTDAYISTFNKIGQIVRAYSEEISVLTDKFEDGRKNWRLYNSQSFDLSFMPFREHSIKKEFTIDSLSPKFIVGGRKTFTREIIFEGKKKYDNDDFTIEWGFRYDATEDLKKYFYVEIWRKKKTGGSIFSVDEYQQLSTKLKELFGVSEDDFSERYHPDEGESEYFLVWLDYKYIDKLSGFFEVCKEDLIEPLLDRIKD